MNVHELGAAVRDYLSSNPLRIQKTVSKYGLIERCCVSKVKDFSPLFDGTSFNEPTANVLTGMFCQRTLMRSNYKFRGAHYFRLAPLSSGRKESCSPCTFPHGIVPESAMGPMCRHWVSLFENDTALTKRIPLLHNHNVWYWHFLVEHSFPNSKKEIVCCMRQ